jgi:DNA-binding NtrC family response regulator
MKPQNTIKAILLISTDEALIKIIGDNLMLQGFKLLIAKAPDEAIGYLEKESIDVIFLDIQSIPMQEMDIVHYAKTRTPQSEIIILTSLHELEEARNALRNGASFYLIKPLSFSDLKIVLDQLVLRVERNKSHIELEQQVLSDLMAGNPAMEKILKLALKIAPTSSTVLIGGETGTGKEFFARIIHRMSGRTGNFVAMNCGAIPDTLFESELFGHRKGSFTGADRDKPGLVEEAHLGTLFLDEVGELTPQAQVKLLRFLQEQTFRRIGETNQRTVNTRIIAASNRKLTDAINEGSFREDLFYRLNVFYLYLPPLRDRKETIPTLIKLFVHRYNTILDKHVNIISKPAEALLANYSYPGNVRELENIIEHAVVLTDGTTMTEKELPEFMFHSHRLLAAPQPGSSQDASQSPTESFNLSEMEKTHITKILILTGYNYTDASKKLGISRSTLWRKIKTYKIKTPKNEG